MMRWIAYGGVTAAEAKDLSHKTSAEELRKNYYFFQERLNEINDALRQNSGVTCFSSRFMNQRMWASYGAGHSGACIQFTNAHKASVVHSHLLPVEYTNEADPLLFPTMFEKDGSTNPSTLARLLYLRKTLDWSDEDEWRILMVADQGQSEDSRRFSFKPNDIRRVFLGLLMQPELRKQIRSIAKGYDWGILEVVPNNSLAPNRISWRRENEIYRGHRLVART